MSDSAENAGNAENAKNAIGSAFWGGGVDIQTGRVEEKVLACDLAMRENWIKRKEDQSGLQPRERREEKGGVTKNIRKCQLLASSLPLKKPFS